MTQDNEIMDRLLRFIRDELSEAEREAVESDIKNDPETARLYAALKDLLKGNKQPQWIGMKEAARLLSERQFDDFAKKNKPGGEKQGIVVYDSGNLPLPEGVRPAAVDTRRIKFLIDNIALELSLYPLTTESYEIIGQIEGIDTDKKLRVKINSKKKDYSAVCDKYKLFRLERIPAGNYSLKIFLGRNIIGIVDIEL